MTEDILTYLAAVGVLPTTSGFELEPLTGGFWNDVYRLRGNGRNWVIKHFRSTNSDGLYPILPQAEALALQTLSGLEIAPELVAFLPDVPLLVYEYFEGGVWQADAVSIGRLLRCLHDVPITTESGFRQLPLETVAILRQGDHFLGQVGPDALVQQLSAVRPLPQLLPSLARLSLVHTDPWPGNIVQNGRHLRLIDWQCPGLGNPTEDVWTFLHAGYEMLLGRPRFDEQVQAEFWHGYGQTTVSQHLPLLAPYYAYRLAAHCLLRQWQLASTNPIASTTYQKIFKHLTSTLA